MALITRTDSAVQLVVAGYRALSRALATLSPALAGELLADPDISAHPV